MYDQFFNVKSAYGYVKLTLWDCLNALDNALAGLFPRFLSNSSLLHRGWNNDEEFEKIRAAKLSDTQSKPIQ